MSSMDIIFFLLDVSLNILVMFVLYEFQFSGFLIIINRCFLRVRTVVSVRLHFIFCPYVITRRLIYSLCARVYQREIINNAFARPLKITSVLLLHDSNDIFI